MTCGFLILMLGGRIVEPFSAQDDFDFLWFFVTLGKEGYQRREMSRVGLTQLYNCSTFLGRTYLKLTYNIP